VQLLNTQNGYVDFPISLQENNTEKSKNVANKDAIFRPEKKTHIVVKPIRSSVRSRHKTYHILQNSISKIAFIDICCTYLQHTEK